MYNAIIVRFSERAYCRDHLNVAPAKSMDLPFIFPLLRLMHEREKHLNEERSYQTMVDLNERDTYRYGSEVLHRAGRFRNRAFLNAGMGYRAASSLKVPGTAWPLSCGAGAKWGKGLLQAV